MPRGTDGTYNAPAGTLVNGGDTILVSQHNPFVNDVSQALTNSLDRNGSGGMRAALSMGGFPIQNVGQGSNSNDAATVGQISSVSMPAGAVVDFAGSTAPSGWLLCFGQAVSRTGYAALFAAVGTQFGAGDGSTTFNLPDCRGRVSAGKDDMGGTPAGLLVSAVNGTVIGAKGGAESCTLETIHMPSHSHAASADVQGEHSHTIQGRAGSDTSGIYVGGASTVDNIKSTNPAGSHTHAITVNPTGGGQAHNNTQPTIIFNKIIKTGI